MIAFRQATSDDIGPLADIWNSGWHEAHAAIVPDALTALRTVHSFRDRLRDDLDKCHVGMRDDKIAGFNISRGGEVYQFYVHPIGRGTGFAGAMLDHAERILAAQNCVTAWLACSVGNARASAFYTRTGWVNTGVQTVDLDTSSGPFPLDVWRFEKRL